MKVYESFYLWRFALSYHHFSPWSTFSSDSLRSFRFSNSFSRILEKSWKLSLTEELQYTVKRVQLNLPSALYRNVSRNMLGVHKRAWTKCHSPLYPMGVTMDLVLRIVTGLTNVSKGYHGCLASPWLGQHQLIIFYSTLCVRHAAYVTRPWSCNYWTSAVLENSGSVLHRSLNANKASLVYTTCLPASLSLSLSFSLSLSLSLFLTPCFSFRVAFMQNKQWLNKFYSSRSLTGLHSYIDRSKAFSLSISFCNLYIILCKT